MSSRVKLNVHVSLDCTAGGLGLSASFVGSRLAEALLDFDSDPLWSKALFGGQCVR